MSGIRKHIAKLLTPVVLLSLGCGPTAFKAGDVNQLLEGPGQFTIPPKIDILLAEDDTGSMIVAFDEITQQFPGFLNELDAQGWDYRFAVAPLTTERPIDQALASKFDNNWFYNGSGTWQQPFPGADPGVIGLGLGSSLFSLPSQFTAFLSPAQVTNQSNQYEPGFETIKNTLTNSPGFLRPDALTVVIAMSNGNDNSGVTFCDRGDGLQIPCEYTSTPELGTAASSFAQYKLDFEALSADFKFYAAVAFSAGTGCLGSTSYIGYRYNDMATELGGSAYNLCSTSVSSVLSGIASNLELEKFNYRTRYLVLGTQPDLDSLVITKYPNGNEGAAQVLAQDPVDGWTYIGYQTVRTVDFPTPLFEATGHIIELHGSAKLWGFDSVRVEFKPEGTSDQSTQ